MSKIQIKSKKRVADHGEVFTAKREVNAMLDLVKHETERIESRFLEPACGNGNFLIEILERKLNIVENRYNRSQIEFEMNAVIAISSLYGVDILNDNVIECRKRLYKCFNEKYDKLYKEKCKEDCRKTVDFILSKNIIWGDALDYKMVNDKSTFITFCEWSPLNDFMIKRRDFTLQQLLANEAFTEYADDQGIEDFMIPDKEYAPINFLKVYNVTE